MSLQSESFHFEPGGLDWIEKGPGELLDYPITIDFAATPGDTITGTPTWTIPTGLTLFNQSNTTTMVVVWLGGGTPGVRYTVSFSAQTAGGRTIERSFEVRVVAR